MGANSVTVMVTGAVARITGIGELTRAGWRKLGEQHGLKLKVGGLPALCTFVFDHGDESRALMTLFTQEILELGFLSNGAFYPTTAHTPEIVSHYLAAVGEVFSRLRGTLDRGEVRTALRGPIAHAGFARLT